MNDATKTDTSASVNEGDVKRAVFASATGNALEWFDFGIYAYMTATIGQVFFPSANSAISLLAAFGGFAVAFLVRPLGGLFFGPLGDKIGRAAVLSITILMMGAGTFAIGLLPGYATLGLWAPILFILARLVQGFSTGGEYGGAATFICEYAPDERRGFFGSFLEFGTLAGSIAAAVLVLGIQSLLSDEAFQAWGWRIPFLMAAPLSLFGLYLRLRLDEGPIFAELKERGEANGGLKELFSSHRRHFLLCMGMVLILNIAYYTVLTYLPTYLKAVLAISATESLLLMLAMMLGMIAVIYLFGALSDKIGRKPVLMGACIGFIVLSWPAFLLLQTGQAWAIMVGLGILGLLTVCLTSTMPPTLPAIFHTRVRYSGFAIAYNLSTALFGGTAGMANQWLIDATGNQLVPAFYLMTAAAIGLLATSQIPETAGKPLPGARAQHEKRRTPAALA